MKIRSNKLSSNQRGIIHHLALFVIVGLVLAGVVFAGWRVWESRDEAQAAGYKNPAKYTKNGPLLVSTVGSTKGAESYKLDLLNINPFKVSKTSKKYFGPNYVTNAPRVDKFLSGYGGGFITYAKSAKTNTASSTNSVEIRRYDFKTNVDKSIFALDPESWTDSAGQKITSRIENYCMTANNVFVLVSGTNRGDGNHQRSIFMVNTDGSDRQMVMEDTPSKLTDLSCGGNKIYVVGNAEYVGPQPQVYPSPDNLFAAPIYEVDIKQPFAKKEISKFNSANPRFFGSMYQSAEHLSLQAGSQIYGTDWTDSVQIINTITNKVTKILNPLKNSFFVDGVLSPDGKLIAVATKSITPYSSDNTYRYGVTFFNTVTGKKASTIGKYQKDSKNNIDSLHSWTAVKQ